jgi:outer membrane protein OmpA-like peptidoglycan-associated protein
VRLALLLALAVAGAAQAADDARELRFVTCPIYRDVDAGRKSGCWLADDPATGRRYDIGLAPTKPDWNNAVLVEGRLSDAKDVCGGAVLDAVRVSVLPNACARYMLPAENWPSRRYQLPVRNVAPAAAPRAVPPGPYADRTFRLVFDFDKAFLVYQLDDYLLDQAITWIRAAKPARIAVTGWAATQATEVSGVRLAENPEIARVRAETVAEALVRLGVARETIDVRWSGDAQPAPADGADGLTEPSRRRVDIAVQVR